MNLTIEQRICLKFCVANGIPCNESHRMLVKCYGETALSKSQTYNLYRMFKTGREFVVDKPRSGRPTTSYNDDNIEKVKELLLENCTLSQREIARSMGISHGSVEAIMVGIVESWHIVRLLNYSIVFYRQPTDTAAHRSAGHFNAPLR